MLICCESKEIVMSYVPMDHDYESKPSTKAIYDALTGSSRDGCDPDWCRDVLHKASSKDIQKVRAALASEGTESEAACRLGVLP
jgi:hypothetical protein